ncbi:MAG: enoyl-CoA hydratase [Devosia sp.]|uniref:enoyl-CoA hydratase n=1 Tax=Devosia sp. TaxID=1871048 RepID=UPI0026281A96|nr:enoyl-CoA hydratase [Devosia sp.]MDB5531309.1 enoyl-CoA hydratase [Devosia sp.]
MSEGRVTLSIEGAVATVLFDHPEAYNAMTFAMYAQLAEACTKIAATPSLRAVAFRGKGKAFVAGTDIREFLDFAGAEDGLAYEQRIEAGIAQIEALPVPTVAIIDGAAMGGGLVIAAACDLRLVSTRARFGVPIARTVGNCLSARNVARLVDSFGLGAVRAMLLLAQILQPVQAVTTGFALEVVEPDVIDFRAAELLTALVANAPLSIAAAREAIRLAARGGDDTDMIRRVYGSADFKEGVRAFIDKRAPVWTGR